MRLCPITIGLMRRCPVNRLKFVPRWEPDARGRLERAAIHLFAENGFNATSVEEIAEAAGLSRSGFFRYFRDKSDIFSGGHDTLAMQFAEAVRDAPDQLPPLLAVETGLKSLAETWFTEDIRHLAPKRRAVIASSPDLQERELLKLRVLADDVAAALRTRGIAELGAAVAAELALLAFTRTTAEWADVSNGESFIEIADRVMKGIARAAHALGGTGEPTS